MSHQISMPDDIYYMVAFLGAVMVLIGVLLFAVEVKELERKKSHR